LVTVLGSKWLRQKICQPCELAPIMPWRAFANLTKDDATAIAVFLKSIPAVKNKVPGPFGPNEKAPEFVMKVVPGEGKN
jgi:hypothetical protein